MNKHCYRLIFNKARGLIMAVSEIASSHSKTAGQTTAGFAAAPRHWPQSASISVLRFSLWAALGMVTFIMPASADIIVDKSTPTNQQPTVLTAANGVAQVNIQTATAGGVSRNSYTEFDVDKHGVILNNSRTDTQTQLGGWVEANQWLAKGEAKIILNEVNSSNPSQLLGYIEVAGGKAQVIVANASGISCDGCGFINASQATLTTGKANIVNGNLDSYSVEKGVIRIDGAGLDARQTDYTALMARALEVNAGIWANKLDVITGANQIDAAQSVATATAKAGTAPAFSVDVSKLGGMYAGQIRLVGTEAGVGVRNAGTLGASAGSVVVTADGIIENSGNVTATAQVQLDNQNTIQNSGTLYAQGDAQLASKGSINNSGAIAAKGNTSLTANGVDSGITSTQGSVLGAGVQADGVLGASGNLNFTATKNIDVQGKSLSGDDQTFTAKSLNLNGNNNSADNLKLTATGGDITLIGATLATTYTLTANTINTLRTDLAKVSAEQLNLTASDLSNVKGELVQVGAGDLNLNFAGNLNNDQGRIASNSQNLSIKAASVTNTSGKLEHSGTGELSLEADTFNNVAGTISSNGLLDIKAASTLLDKGTLSAEQLHIDSAKLSNRSGSITQRGSGATQITTANQFDNTSGSLISRGTTTLVVGSLANQGGKIQMGTETSAADVTITAAGTVDNMLQQGTRGTITATGNTSVTAESLNNSEGDITAAKSLTVTSAKILNNEQGLLAGKELVSVQASGIENTHGIIGSLSNEVEVTAAGGKLNNTAGRIEAAQAVTVSGVGVNNTKGVITGSSLKANSQLDLFDNTQGTLTSSGTLDLQTGALLNETGLVQAQSALSINTHGQTLTNTHSSNLETGKNPLGILGLSAINLTSGTLDNTTGFIGSLGALTAQSGAVKNLQGGSISSADTLRLNGTSLDNQGGQIQALGDTALTFSESIDNRASLIRTDKYLTISTASLNNANTLSATAGDSKTQQNTGIDAQSIDLAATQVTNNQGALRADANLTLSSHGILENNQGLISAGATATLKDTELANRTLQVNNSGGTLIAGQSLSVDSAGLAGDGQVLSEGDLVLTFVGDYSNTTKFQANGSASLTTIGIFTNQSSLLAGTELILKATTIENQANAEIGADKLSLTATDALNNRGLINAKDTFIYATTLNNLGTGKIYGDHIAIKATTVTNDVEVNAAGEPKAAVIAARDRLDIAAETINNREHALFFSVKDIAIGGSLDATTHKAIGQAKVLNNESANIEAMEVLDLSVQQINNINKHMETTEVTRTEEVVAYEGILSNKGVGKIYREGSPGVYIVNHQSDYLHTPEQEYQQWQAYRYSSTITETQLVNSDPARISSGAEMNINAKTLINNDSIIVAGGAITNPDVLDNLKNYDTKATLAITNVGTLTDYYRDFESGRDRTGHHGPYTWKPAPTIKPIKLIPYAGYDVDEAEPINSGTQVAVPNKSAVTEAPAGVAAATVNISKAPAINLITEIPLVTAIASDANQQVVRTGGVNTQLPNNSLYTINPSTNASYLVETDPNFTDNRLWLNSDYLLDTLAFDPAITQTRLGDGFYEQQLIREQIALLTGRRFLEGYSDDEAQYLALMNNATTYIQDYNLRPGVALSAEQMAALTSDIVWLVETSVSRADGTTTKVLAPQVYVRVKKGDIDGAGGLISGNSIDLKFTDDLTNSGTLAGRTLVKLDAKNIENLGGRISAETLDLKARQDLLNLGGKMDAVSSMTLAAERDIKVASTTVTGTSDQGSRTDIDRLAGLYVTGDDGKLIMTAGRDVMLDAAQIINKAPTGAGTGAGITSVTAGNNLSINSLTESESQKIPGGFKTSHDSEVGSVIYTQGMLRLRANNDLEIKASQLNALGNVALDAGNDVNTTSVANQQQYASKNSRHTIVDASVKNSLVDITSGGAVTIKAGKDATLTGTGITSAADTAIRAKGDTTINAVVDSEYSYSQDTKKSFGKRKTTSAENLNETIVGGTINSDGDLLINAHKNSNGTIISEASGTVNLAGVDFKSKNDLAIAADKDVNITGINYETLDYRDSKKSSGFGLSKKDKGAVESESHLLNANIEAGGNAHVLAGQDINLAATNILADGNIDLQAVDNLLITAGEAVRSSEEWSTKSGVFSGGDIYSKSIHEAGEGFTEAQSSNLIAAGKITAKAGTGQIIGSTISGDQGVTLASDAGNFDIVAARSTNQTYSRDETVSVGLGDLGKTLSRPDELIKSQNGRAKIKLADAQFDSEKTKSTDQSMLGSVIESKGDVKITASAGEVNVQGSTLAADTDYNKDGTLALAGATGVNIKEASNSYESETKAVHGSAELSLIVQNQAVEVANAAKAVDQAKDQLEQAKKDYKAFERNLDQLETQLTQLESDYANKIPGAAYQDVLDLREQIKDSEGYKKEYQAGLALAAVNLSSSVTALMQQTKTLANSGGTYGFNAGLQLDVDATTSTSVDSSNRAQASYLSGNNILIQTGSKNADGTFNTLGADTTIQGSHLSATNSITLDTDELNLLNSTDTSQHKNQTEHGHITTQITAYGATGGASVNGSLDRSRESSTSTTINNTTLHADSITLNTKGDANIRGANVHADSLLTTDIQGDLNLESQQNRSRSDSKSAGVSGGFSLGGQADAGTPAGAKTSRTGGNAFTNNLQGAGNVGDSSGSNGGVNASNGMSATRDTVLTSLTSGGTANVKVKGNTQITAALIGTVDAEGKATNNLNFDTKTLTFTDLRNTNQSNQTSGSLSTNFSAAEGEKDSSGQTLAKDGKDRDLRPSTSNLIYENSQSNDASKTLATLGHGNITVGGAQLEQNGELTDVGKAAPSLIALNRDASNIEKELWNSEQSQTVDATLDHRLLTEDGWNQIAEDVKRSEVGMQSIIALASEDVSLLGDQAGGKTSFRQNLADGQNFIDAGLAFSDPKNEKYIEDLTSGVASPEAKQEALTAFANVIASESGVSPVEALTLVQDRLNLNTNTYEGTHVKQRITGAYAADPNGRNGEGLIFSVDDNQATTTDTIDSLGHELSHHMDAARDQNVDKAQSYKDNRDLYAERMGNLLVDATNFSFTNSGYDALGAVNQHLGARSDRGTIQRNNATFNSLDANAVDYRQLAIPEIDYVRNSDRVQRFADEIKATTGKELTTKEAQARLLQGSVGLMDQEWQEIYGTNAQVANFLMNEMARDINRIVEQRPIGESEASPGLNNVLLNQRLLSSDLAYKDSTTGQERLLFSLEAGEFADEKHGVVDFMDDKTIGLIDEVGVSKTAKQRLDENRLGFAAGQVTAIDQPGTVLVDGIVGTASGVWDFVTSPIDTSIDTWKGFQELDAYGNLLSFQGRDYDIGYLNGYSQGGIAVAGVAAPVAEFAGGSLIKGAMARASGGNVSVTADANGQMTGIRITEHAPDDLGDLNLNSNNNTVKFVIGDAPAGANKGVTVGATDAEAGLSNSIILSEPFGGAKTIDILGEKGIASDRSPGVMAEGDFGYLNQNPKSIVSTDKDEAFFWSGRTAGIGGANVAQDIAKVYGGTTLESLIEARGVKMPAWDTNNTATVQAWKNIAAEYAQGASGTVRAVIGENMRPGNVWEVAELPALKNNPKVTKIVTIDPATGKENIIFERDKK